MKNLLSIFSVLALLLFMCPQDAMAQRGGGDSGNTGFDQAIKIGPFGFLFGSYNATYEHQLKDKSSFVVGARYSGGVPGLDDFTAFGLNAQYRIYFKQAIESVYLAPNLSFASNISSIIDDSSFSNISPGVNLGWQWIWDGGFVLDLGIGARYRLGLGESDPTGLGDFDGVRPNFQIQIGYAF